MTVTLLLSALAVLLGIAIHAVFFAPVDLRREELDVEIADLPRPFEGYTIVVLADIHQPSIARLDYLRRVVRHANEVSPDLVVLLGDLGISFKHNRALSRRLYARMLPRTVPLLLELAARDGIVAILGNHEHYAHPPAVVETLRRHGMRVLVNQCLRIDRSGAALAIGGVDDAQEGKVDAAAALGEVSPEVPRLLLSHSPDAALSLDGRQRIDLMLAGHTHGGQVVIPGYGAPLTLSRVCGRRTASGWIPGQAVRLYVSRGVGCQIPLRFFCPPELTIVRLRRCSTDQQSGGSLAQRATQRAGASRSTSA